MNAHHPLWETDAPRASRHADTLLSAFSANDLSIITPADLGTFLSPSGRCSTIDLAFGSPSVNNSVTKIQRQPEDHGSDHFGVELWLDWSAIEEQSPRLRLKPNQHLAFAAQAARNWEDTGISASRLTTADDVEKAARCLVDAVSGFQTGPQGW